jgi:hypothetical protein
MLFSQLPAGWPPTKRGRPMTRSQIRRSIVTVPGFAASYTSQPGWTPLKDLSDEALVQLYKEYR